MIGLPESTRLTENEMELKDYLVAIAKQLVNELKPILEVKGVTSNTDLLGRYTEAAVRRFPRSRIGFVCSASMLEELALAVTPHRRV